LTQAEKIVLEVCAYSLEAAIAAQAGDADRVELCANPREGGVTPSYGDIVLARQNLKIELHVLIRPRGGDFLYTSREFAAMKEDIQLCKRLGIDGVSLGILLPNGQVDRERCRELVDFAKPVSVTFHRAFDMAADPFAALEEIIAIGCDRILTSGQANSALQGASLIRDLVVRAGERIVIMTGGGVREENLAELIATTHAREFHTSARTSISSGMEFRNPKVSLGGGEGEYELVMVDQQQVAKMREIADQSSVVHARPS